MVSEFDHHRHRITLVLILALHILRIPVVTGVRLFVPEMPDWLSAVYQIGTYLLLAILLIWENENLQEYHINDLAIWIIILFKPVETIYLFFWSELNSPLAFPKLPGLFIWAIALFLMLRFRSRLFQKRAIQRVDLKWALLGSLAGLAAVFVFSYPESLGITRFGPDTKISVSTVLISGLMTIPYQIGYAAISEEPVFRGFLWGYLRKYGWRDGWIWLFQTGLFMLAHLFYINAAPISFWFIVPLGGIILGWLAWRSRSIATSMLAHGVVNGLTRSFGIIVAILR